MHGPIRIFWANLTPFSLKAAHGDCRVPRRWAEDPRLSTWVGRQRVCKLKLDRGEPGPGMTAARAARLTALGFAWGPLEPPQKKRKAAAAAAPEGRAATANGTLAMRLGGGPVTGQVV